MSDTRHPFAPATLMYAPAAPGVYMLWDRDVLLFVGHARGPQTILERLMDHYCGRSAPAHATHCSWELIDINTWIERVGRVGTEAPEISLYAEAD